MANELSTRLTLDGSSFNQELENATQKVEKFQDVTSDATKSIQDLGNKGSRSTRELLSEINKISGAERSTSNYRRQLMQMQKDIQDLTINYRAMNSEMKNSAIGQETLSKINELTAKAGEYKDAINDAQQSIQRLASDTAMWDGMKQGIDTVSSGLQAFVAAGVLGEKSTEKLVAVIARLKAIEAATNAVIKIGNALQRNSALMMSISTIQSRALAAAKTAEAAATGKATIAQKAFNVVAKANPYVLLATAIIAAVSAIALYTRHTEKARIEEEKQQKLLERAEDNYNNYKNTVSKAVGDVTGKFKVLQTQYQNLRTEMEKLQFIKDNADEFEKLGLKVDDVNDADKIFITQSEQVIKALQARARAAAAAALYQESYAKQIEAEIEAEKLMQDARTKTIDKRGAAEGTLPRKDWDNAGLSIKNGDITSKTRQTIGQGGGMTNIPTYELTPQGEEKLRKYYEELAKTAGEELINQARSDSKILEDIYVNAMKDAADATKATNGLVTNPSKGKTTVEVTVHPEVTTEETREILSQISLLKEKKKLLEDELPYIKEGTTAYYDQLYQINEINQAIQALEQEAKDYVDSLNFTPSGEAPKTEIGIQLNQEDVQTVYQQFDDMIDRMERVGGAVNAIPSAVNATYSAFKNLGEALDECENGWEAFFTVFQAGMQAFNTFTSILSAMNTLMEMFNVVTATATTETTAETAATTANTAAKSANAAETITDAAATGVLTAMEGGKSVASIPIVGAVLAAAAIASLLAIVFGALASAKGYATGGIVGGNSTHGDKILARVNSKEMVITQGQQARLWNFINGGELVGNQNNIEFKIRGTDLIGVLNNVGKKQSRI